MDAEGYVRIAGRVKEMIIRGGENIYPKEIENSLLEHNDISEVAIVGLPDEKFGEIVGCFLKFEKGQKLTSTDLKSFIREKISPQKTPAVWVEIDEWPLTGSGKIKRKHAFKNHILTKKSKKRKLRLTHFGLVHESDENNIKRQLRLK